MINRTINIVNDIFNQAKLGIIELGNDNFGYWTFYVNFFTEIEGNCNATKENIPILNIPNYNLFIKKVDEYLEIAREFYHSDRDYFCLDAISFDKKLFMDLIVNTSNYDLHNIYNYIETRKSMLENKINQQIIPIGEFQDYKILGGIGTCVSNLEAPYKFELAFDDRDGNRFKLPSITFGIVDDTIYIYAIQRKITKNSINEKNPCEKKLDRLFRKVNKNIEADSDVSQISPNALVSLSLFLSFMKKNGYKKVIAPIFMPIRYNANLTADSHNVNTYEEKTNFEQKREQIQFNITNKFSYLFFRYFEHFNNTDIFFNEQKEQIELELLDFPFEKRDDNLIYEIDGSVKASSILRENQQKGKLKEPILAK